MTEIKKTPDGIEIPPPGPDDVLYEKKDGFALVTMNRPTVLNAMNKNILRLLGRALDTAEADDDVGAGLANLRSGEKDRLNAVKITIFLHALHQHRANHATPSHETDFQHVKSSN